MRIVLWQNVLSPHQLPYIVRLIDDARVDEVVLAVEKSMTVERKEMGWEVPKYNGLEKCKVYIAPSPKIILNLLRNRQEDSWHLFSGIRGFRFVYDAFQKSLAFNIRCALITERPNTYAFGRANGKPLWLHKIRYLTQDRKNIKHVEKVFAMGTQAVDFFRGLRSGWKVHPFLYCTSSVANADASLGGITKMMFVGSLNLRKSTETLISSFSKGRMSLDIIGDGGERQRLEKIAEKYGKGEINFLGSCKNSDVQQLMCQHDVLVLPSIYDGWGAVVNEALMHGMYVIVSDKCGASDLVDADRERGVVFRSGNVKALSEALLYVADNINIIRDNRISRAQWAKTHISGAVVAKYMVDCLVGLDVQPPYID